MVDDPLISIAEAARKIGLNKSTLSRQIKAGSIRAHGGKVRLSEVLTDRADNIDASIRGNPSKTAIPVAALNATRLSLHDATLPDEDDDDQVGTVLVDGKALPINTAKALKETYLARLAKLKFETESGTLVESAVVHKAVFERFRQVRDSWTNWVAQNAPMIAAELGVDQIKLAVIMEEYVRRQLAELAQTPVRISG